MPTLHTIPTLLSLSGKTICILGYGKEGRAMAEALEQYAPECEITIADEDEGLSIKNEELNNVKWKLGKNAFQDLNDFDVLIKSPGIPPSQLLTVNCQLFTPTQIFFTEALARGATIIGVTGSKGKSTTASLIAHILKVNCQLLKVNCYLIGNIGEPAIAHLHEASPNTIFVHELSSYQLMDLTVSPQIAVLTSLFPEHLNYHGSLENYYDAKANIARFQKEDDLFIFNAENDECAKMAALSIGTKIGVTPENAPITLEETKLQGRHNLGNIALAAKVCASLGVPEQDIIAAIKTFTPLPHRLQSLGIHHNIEWVNDSISTTPESVIAALDALGDRVKTIILGGQDRGYDFSKLRDRLKYSSVKTIILLPESGRTIGAMIKNAQLSIGCIDVETMEEAVKEARKIHPHPLLRPSDSGGQASLLPKGEGDTSRYPLSAIRSPIVLLSPASPSYGQFKNFEERGREFEKWILTK